MESYHGLILTSRDAMILLEAARIGMIPKTNRRLSEFERTRLINNGAIFIWDELESGMKRWTDGKSWSASRVSGSFLVYKEMENTKNFTFYSSGGDGMGSGHQLAGPGNEESYRYKNNGLIKQSFSITLNNNAKLHLISYINHSYLKKNSAKAQAQQLHQQAQFDLSNQEFLQRPSEDPIFKNLKFDPSLYPETILTYQDSIPDFQPVDTMQPQTGKPQSPSYHQPQQQQLPQHLQAQNNYRVQSIDSSPISSAGFEQYQSPRLYPMKNYGNGGVHQQQQHNTHHNLHQAQAPYTSSSLSSHHQQSHQMSNLDSPTSSTTTNGSTGGYFALNPHHNRSTNSSAITTPHGNHLQHLINQTNPTSFSQPQSPYQYQGFVTGSTSPSQNSNVPVHHREDGLYLSMLDRRFSS